MQRSLSTFSYRPSRHGGVQKLGGSVLRWGRWRNSGKVVLGPGPYSFGRARAEDFARRPSGPRSSVTSSFADLALALFNSAARRLDAKVASEAHRKSPTLPGKTTLHLHG